MINAIDRTSNALPYEAKQSNNSLLVKIKKVFSFIFFNIILFPNGIFNLGKWLFTIKTETQIKAKPSTEDTSIPQLLPLLITPKNKTGLEAGPMTKEKGRQDKSLIDSIHEEKPAWKCGTGARITAEKRLKKEEQLFRIKNIVKVSLIQVISGTALMIGASAIKGLYSGRSLNLDYYNALIKLPAFLMTATTVFNSTLNHFQTKK